MSGLTCDDDFQSHGAHLLWRCARLLQVGVLLALVCEILYQLTLAMRAVREICTLGWPALDYSTLLQLYPPYLSRV
jgi:hypothetical protein